MPYAFHEYMSYHVHQVLRLGDVDGLFAAHSRTYQEFTISK